ASPTTTTITTTSKDTKPSVITPGIKSSVATPATTRRRRQRSPIPRLIPRWRSHPNPTHLRHRLESSSPSTTVQVNAILEHLTDIRPCDYDRVINGDHNEERLTRFSRLHSALHHTSTTPEAIWAAYNEIRKIPQDFELLSQDVLRLIVIHFKGARTHPHKWGNANPYQEMVNETYCTWIVTLLKDKRRMKERLRFTAWDFSDLMSALNRLERYEESLKELDQALRSSIKLDSILLNHAVRAWGGLGDLEMALKTIRNVQTEHNVKASEYTIGYIIQKLLISGRRPEAVMFWQELIRDGYMEDIETANGILRACANIVDNRFAVEVYDSLPGLKIESNLESLNVMLRLAVMEIQHMEDKNVFLQGIHDKMIRTDNMAFDRDMLGSILINFSKKGDADGVIKVHRLMTLLGLPPGIEEYNDVLHCYARLEQMDKAIDWFQHMRQVGVRPNLPSYVLLMQSYARQRMPRETEALFRQLISDGLEPDLAVCNYLLLAYEQARMNRRCLQLYTSMFLNPSIGVDQATFSCMFNAIFHNDKALLEGSEGIGAQGSTILDMRFAQKISEPFGPTIHTSTHQDTMVLEDSKKNNKFGTCSDQHQQQAQPLFSPHTQQRCQFDPAMSTTETLNPRTLFRDMIIVGIRPSRSLYSNILRAFLAQDDCAGAAVAIRALVDYYVLKPTPKMNGIIVAWMAQQMKKKGAGNKENVQINNELSKLINMMSRSRGLIDMLEKAVYTEQWTSTLAMTPNAETLKGKEQKKKGSSDNQPPVVVDPIAIARMEMGGDLVDLTLESVLAGSSWSTIDDNTYRIDLQDFGRWFHAYSNRIRYARMIKEKHPELTR
ncbi:hypothetical protein BGZ65_006211, partial [Modicella reniformis]